MAAEEVKATLDFTGTAWNIPTSGTNTEAAQFTDGTYTITLAAATNYKQNSGYLILGKQGSTLTLPAFTWKTTKIRVTGSSGASESVKQNIFVGETAVSTETTGAKNVTNEYAIAAAYQAAGNVYVLKVTSSHNTQITKIEVYGESDGTPAEPVVANFCLTEVGHLMEATPAQDSYVLLSIGSKGGKTIVRIDQDGEKNTAMFDYLQVTGLTQTGEDVAEGGVAAMAVEFDTPALTNDSMTLEILWSTVNWPGRWMVQNLRVAVADCQYAVVPLVPITCAEVYNMAKNDEVLLNDLTVTYVNGKNVYVKDASGAMLLYLPDAAEWAAGDVLSGVEGTVDIYKNLYEVKPSAEQVAAVVTTAGEAPAPVEMTAAPVAADMNKYVVLKNVSVSAASFPDNKNMDATIGEQTFILRNNFNANIAFDTEKTYDITGVVAVYNDNVQVYFISAEEYVAPVIPADRRINAYGLNVVANGDDYAFSYYANIAGEEANLLFYKDGVLQGRVAVDAPKQGVNDVTLAKSEIPEGTGLTWAVELKANPVAEFAKIAEGSNLMKCHLAIDNSPESDYFGRMYVTNRAGSASGGIYIYNQDFTVKTSNTLAGQPKWQSMGRPSVADDGTVYIGDWGDSHGGVYVMNPATETATCLFDGTQDASTGLWTNTAGVAMGSSTASVGVYGSGENTVLYAMNEDASTAGTTLYAHGANVYQLGQADGSVLSTWNVAPTKTFAVLDNAAQMFVINPISKGAFFSCSRAKPNNASGARSLQFYNTDGERTYVALPEGATADLTGSLGGGCAVSRDEDVLAIVDGDGNILVYNIAWNVDTPSLTLATKYTTEFAALGSLCFDYAGNIVVTAGANYNNSTANKLVAYGVPTDKNEIIVPAKKALVVEGTDENPSTAIEDIYVLEVQKVIRNGQVLIIKDGKTYNMMGQIVE